MTKPYISLKEILSTISIVHAKSLKSQACFVFFFNLSRFEVMSAF